MLTMDIPDSTTVTDGTLTIFGPRVRRYRLKSELKAGANARVFDAEHIDRRCVVKLWLREGVDWEDRFRRGFGPEDRKLHKGKSVDHNGYLTSLQGLMPA